MHRQGEPFFLAEFVDITERQRAQAEAEAARESFQALFNFGPVTKTLVRIADGLIVDVNHAAEAMFGYRREELVGRPVRTLDYWADPAEQQRASELFRQQGFIRDFEFAFKTKSGALGWAVIFAQVVEQHGQPCFLAEFVEITERKQGEAALHESEERYLRLFTQSATPTILLQLPEVAIVDANEAAERLTGFTRAEMLGRTAVELGLTSAAQRHAAIDSFQKQGRLAGRPGQLRSKTGAMRFVEINTTQVLINGRPHALSTLLDLTERVRAEAERDQLLERLNLAARAAGLGIWDWDIRADQLIWDDQMYRLYGLPAGGFGGAYEAWLQGVHPEDRAASNQVSRQAIRREREYDTEFRVIWPDGTVRWLKANGQVFHDAQGEPLRMVGVNYDITERKRAELAVRQSEARFHSLYTSMVQGVVYQEAEAGRITSANPAAERILGLPLDQLLSQTSIDPRSLAVHEDGSAFRAADHPALAALRTGEPVTGVVMGLLNPQNDARRWILINAIPQFQAGAARPFQVFATLEDITERKLAEEQLRQSEATLARRVAERTADLSRANTELARASQTKDEFLANMSHELRTPLNAILSFAEILTLQTRGPLTEPQLTMVGHIASSGRHLLDLINDILDLSKVEAGRLELDLQPAIVADVCQASLALVREPALKKSLSLNVQYSNQLAQMMVDVRRLKQMLVNLLNNAVKFTPAHGQVSLDVSLDAEGGRIQFAIQDTGIGIAADDLGRLFQAFTQIDSSLSRQYEGSGLGLALVRRLAELHGGSISVESVLGQGSRFTLSLPYQAPPTPAAGGSALSRPRSALVVEDSASAAEQIAHYLQTLNISVVIHPRGAGALEAVQRLQPEVIILDLLLPDQSGWEVLEQLRTDPVAGHIPVIIVSVVDERARGRAAGAAAYLVKPITREQLAQGLAAAAQVVGRAMIIAPAGQPAGPRLLLAEDNLLNSLPVNDYLQSLGYDVMVVRTGREAVDLALETRPALILMDIQMPEMDGLTATQKLRARPETAKVPIIALTALAMPGDRERCLAAGANTYLTKPVHLKSLAELIQQMLATAGETP